MDRTKPDQRFRQFTGAAVLQPRAKMKQLKPNFLSYSYIPASLIPYLIAPFFFRDRAINCNRYFSRPHRTVMQFHPRFPVTVFAVHILSYCQRRSRSSIINQFLPGVSYRLYLCSAGASPGESVLAVTVEPSRKELSITQRTRYKGRVNRFTVQINCKLFYTYCFKKVSNRHCRHLEGRFFRALW